MSCSSLPVATAPYFVRAPSSLTDLMFGVGQERGRVLARLGRGRRPGRRPARSARPAAPRRWRGAAWPRRPRPARSGRRARRRCTARRARRSCRRWPRSALRAARPAPSCRRSSCRSRAAGSSAPSGSIAAIATTGMRRRIVIGQRALPVVQRRRWKRVPRENDQDRRGATGARVDKAERRKHGDVRLRGEVGACQNRRATRVHQALSARSARACEHVSVEHASWHCVTRTACERQSEHSDCFRHSQRAD